MEQILNELGLSHKIGVFRQNKITQSTFEYLMSPSSNNTAKVVVMKDTGINEQQLYSIMQKIRQGFGKQQPQFPKTK